MKLSSLSALKAYFVSSKQTSASGTRTSTKQQTLSGFTVVHKPDDSSDTSFFWPKLITMGRKQFKTDLATVIDNPPSHIQDVRTPDDGEIGFDYVYTSYGAPKTAALKLLIPNVDDYPHEHECFLFAEEGEAAPNIVSSLDVITPLLRSRSIYDALAEISNCLHMAITSGQFSNPIVLNSASEDERAFNTPVRGCVQPSHIQDDEDLDDFDDVEADSDIDDEHFQIVDSKKASIHSLSRKSQCPLPAGSMKKIKRDLREAKQAGFKVGIIGNLGAAGIVCVSLRISKMGISEDVMKAWGLQPQLYFVVLIKCSGGYATLDNVMGSNIMDKQHQIRVGLCSSYKPNQASALDAFSEGKSDEQQASQPVSAYSDNLVPMFISHSLNDLFKHRFGPVTRYRDAYMLGWAGAEQLAFDTQGSFPREDQIVEYITLTDNIEHRALPPIVMDDAMAGRRADQCSLPLVAMQFALRHFVRCTDFCLVCHCSSGSTFEALKPYVCSKEICLYQYLFLGFGPSIEWEILSQPYVVDLLISFCWLQARVGKLKQFPAGISLQVPILPQFASTAYAPQSYHHPYNNPAPNRNSENLPSTAPSFSILYNGAKNELIFQADKLENGKRLKLGEFIALKSSNFNGVVYHCVVDILLPSVKLGPPIYEVSDTKEKTLSDKFLETDCYLFDTLFDNLPKDYQNKAIIAMLDILPSVKDMVQFLKTHNSAQEISLRNWKERIPAAALNILRWIVASNRSCIMQVDTVLDSKLTGKDVFSLEDRVTGMENYMQFRFASGAPDKEQKFIDNVSIHASGKAIPTIFAWHGSPLHNWHSIVREGLRFDEVAHGRAYGNGVYMSLQAATSVAYMNMGYRQGTGLGWINSEIKLSGAMSLNEVVNKPEAFVSRSPHYVVADTDWIQTRYLFVQTQTPHSTKNRTETEFVVQDAAHCALGMNYTTISIPITAIAKSRRSLKQNEKQETRKRKSLGSGRAEDPFMLVDDDAESIATVNEDREYLLDDESHTGHTPVQLDSDTDMADYSDNGFDDYIDEIPKKKMRQAEPQSQCQLIDGCLLDMDKTDFIPGANTLSSIQTLPPPSDASRTATAALSKAFKDLVKTQATTPAHDLGWYMNPEGGENLYQWLIELHSFDKRIPLAADMKKVGVSSIILEMRFTNQFPFAPPFVRVVKPKFLPFNQGGGGHITEGGAICMELLTNDGWTAVSSIESVLLQIRLTMSEEDKPARLLSSRGYGRFGGGNDSAYGVGEAITAYERYCRAHNWTVPPAFKSLQRG